jgi:hypothetical protein
MPEPRVTVIRMGGGLIFANDVRTRLFVGPLQPGDQVDEVQVRLSTQSPVSAATQEVITVSVAVADQPVGAGDDTFDALPIKPVDSVPFVPRFDLVDAIGNTGYWSLDVAIPVLHRASQRGRYVVVDVESQENPTRGTIFLKIFRPSVDVRAGN